MVTGSQVRTFIPTAAEGDVISISLVTANDQHTVYYHSAKRTIQVFRIDTGAQICFNKSTLGINVMKSSADGRSLILGPADDRVEVLILANPYDNEIKTRTKYLSSRTPFSREEKPKLGFRAMARVAHMVAKAKNQNKQQSRTCVSDVLREVQLVIYFYFKKVYAFNCINNRTIDGQGERRITKRIIQSKQHRLVDKGKDTERTAISHLCTIQKRKWTDKDKDTEKNSNLACVFYPEAKLENKGKDVQ
ncbi:hypothetical protein CAPTEDRAFT_204558 [Capitella teleta]|uniref:NWD2 C-terminal beta-propeller domain-containing protein n=1 Tax=Capitella teleta TaxID=283909 RepID=R7TWM4_CAPTE|nr:hypothetical protein CAPTEDRAFT_204558 [Capitella teleta]|eukprot:ELT98012.1 hypothetical protein CAPTEDRAFT_204558 [Capitella teleta]